MSSITKYIGLAAIILWMSPVPAHSAEHHHHSPESTQVAQMGPSFGGNPLVDEMMILDSVFKEIVSGVALGDGPRVFRAVESLHGTMAETQHALRSGFVRPPKNPEKLQEFETLDRQFHGQLDTLAQAAIMNDQRKMADITKKLLDGCVKCHEMFRR